VKSSKKGKRKKEKSFWGRNRKREREGGGRGDPKKRFLAFESKHEPPGSECSSSSFYSSTVLSFAFAPLSGLSLPARRIAEKRKEKISSNNTILREEERITAVRVSYKEKKKDEMRKPERGKNIIILGAPCETRELPAPPR